MAGGVLGVAPRGLPAAQGELVRQVPIFWAPCGCVLVGRPGWRRLTSHGSGRRTSGADMAMCVEQVEPESLQTKGWSAS